jgi:hypothetical protein
MLGGAWLHQDQSGDRLVPMRYGGLRGGFMAAEYVAEAVDRT